MAARLRAVATEGVQSVTVAPINNLIVQLEILGTAPLVINAFSEKAKQHLAQQMATEQAKKKSKKDRPPRDYDAEFAAAHHYAAGDEAWVGIACNGIRSCAIEGCRLAGVMMTRAKQGMFAVPDGWDRVDGQGLFRLIASEAPEKTLMHVRNENNVVDLRCRPMWRNWSALITIKFDADWISLEHVINLVNRGGEQVGIHEGRPGSPNSHGMGWGTFRVKGVHQAEKQELPSAADLINLLEEEKAATEGRSAADD